MNCLWNDTEQWYNASAFFDSFDDRLAFVWKTWVAGSWIGVDTVERQQELYDMGYGGGAALLTFAVNGETYEIDEANFGGDMIIEDVADRPGWILIRSITDVRAVADGSEHELHTEMFCEPTF